MSFTPLENSDDHVLVSVSIDSPLNILGVHFFIAQVMAVLVLIGMVFLNNWQMFCGMISFKRSASAAGTESFEWVQVGIDVYISYRRY